MGEKKNNPFIYGFWSNIIVCAEILYVFRTMQILPKNGNNKTQGIGAVWDKVVGQKGMGSAATADDTFNFDSFIFAFPIRKVDQTS